MWARALRKRKDKKFWRPGASRAFISKLFSLSPDRDVPSPARSVIPLPAVVSVSSWPQLICCDSCPRPSPCPSLPPPSPHLPLPPHLSPPWPSICPSAPPSRPPLLLPLAVSHPCLPALICPRSDLPRVLGTRCAAGKRRRSGERSSTRPLFPESDSAHVLKNLLRAL